MDKMKKRLYLISVNGKIYDAIEITGNGTKELISKIENLVKKFMWANYSYDPQFWERLSSFHYHAVDPDSKQHYDIRLDSVMLWTDNELNEYY